MLQYAVTVCYSNTSMLQYVTVCYSMLHAVCYMYYQYVTVCYLLPVCNTSIWHLAPGTHSNQTMEHPHFAQTFTSKYYEGFAFELHQMLNLKLDLHLNNIEILACLVTMSNEYNNEVMSTNFITPRVQSREIKRSGLR